MTAPLSPRVDAAEAHRVLAEAFSRSHSPSDRIAYAWDDQLVDHPEWCATDTDYPDWTPGQAVTP